VAPLLMQIYNRRLKNKLARLSIDYDLLNFNKDFPLLAEIAPLIAMNRLKAKIEKLPEKMRNDFNSLNSQKDNPDVVDIIEDFERFRKKFGHLSNSGTDFSVAKWEEDPGLMFKMVVETPHIIYNRELISFSEVTYSKLKYPGLRSLYNKAGKFKVYREQVSSLYIFGYGLFRTLFLGVGKEFVNNGIIERKEDIFYLSIKEVDEIVAAIGRNVVKKYIDEVIIRKKEMAGSKDLLLPSVIFGDEAPIVESESIKNMKGVGTSPGVYRGRTKIVRKFSDFSKVNRGEVIIIPFSDISWTPVLCKAGAIVAESGGMLSHFSIIAREMGIPSLASVENACALKDNMLVTVDGSNGILTVHDYE